MTAMPPRLPSQSAHDLVVQLHAALKHAEGELQRRCFISTQIKEALAAADQYMSRIATLR